MYINKRNDKEYVILMNDYFKGNSSTFSDIEFRRRFRIKANVFFWMIAKAGTKLIASPINHVIQSRDLMQKKISRLEK